MVGETGNFIFDLWKTYDFSAGQMAPNFEDGLWVPDGDRAACMVQSCFLSCFPDSRKHWFHKPIGVPRALAERYDEKEWSKAASWYWSVMKSTFPKARYITLVRQPCDVVASAKAYWGFDEAAIWGNYAFMCYLLLHPDCPVKYVISYEEMIMEPEATVRALFENIGVDFDVNVLSAFSTVHVPSKGRDQLPGNGCQGNAGSRLNMSVNPEHLDTICDMFAKYGKSTGITGADRAEAGAGWKKTSADADASPRDDEIKRLVDMYNNKIEIINSEHNQKLLNREREFYEIFRKDQDWMAKLAEDKKWLAAQIERQQKQIAELQEKSSGKA